MILKCNYRSLKQGAVFFVYKVYHSYKIKYHRVLTNGIRCDTLVIMDVLAEVKRIQIDRGLNDTQMSELLGYKTREGWARIKGGVVPANEVFQLRALRAFPELATAPSNKQKSVGSVLKDIYLKVKKFV